jgi:5-methyltetrahydrofolate--homocysteine methyltransferase
MPEMEAAVKMRNEQKLNIPIIIGGAAVTKKYADKIGADFYAKDAIETANIISELNKSLKNRLYQ